MQQPPPLQLRGSFRLIQVELEVEHGRLAGPHCGWQQAVVSEPKQHPSEELERSKNLATSQLASLMQFQVCDRLSFKFVIAASRPQSLRSRVFCMSVSSS